MIGVLGVGRTGTQVVEHLLTLGQVQITVSDTNTVLAKRLADRLSTQHPTVRAVAPRQMFETNVVVLATPAPHAAAARRLLEAGVSVVSCSDDVDDTLAMLDLDAVARSKRHTLVVGSTMSPGLSGLLVREMQGRFDSIDEAHVAVHGTAGPACAQQHHRALAGQSIGWHDGDWLKRPAGSGRELCWFPDPIGPRDCYRASLSDPIALHYGLAQLARVTVRMSATRRDRLTARLPMLTPPHAEGGLGALRVEVRGWRGDARHLEILGVAGRVAEIAGAVAAATARAVSGGGFASGVRVVGDEHSPNNDVLGDVLTLGVRVNEFVGTS